MDYCFIVNPASGKGSAQKLLVGFESLLQELNLRYTILYTTSPGEASTMAMKAAGEYDAVIATGGDGTINEVVNGLMSAKQTRKDGSGIPAFGVVPIGSGNDFAKALKIPADVYRSLEILKQGAVEKTDIGEFSIDRGERRYFANNVGIGFDGQVNYESSKITRLTGMAMYLSAVLKTLFTYRHPKTTIRSDHEIIERKILLVNAGNGISSGGGFYLTPDAVLGDGFLDVCIIDSMNKMKIIQRLPKVLDGSHTGTEGVTMFRTTTLRVESDDELPVHADGEIVALSAKRVDVSIHPAALNVIKGS